MARERRIARSRGRDVETTRGFTAQPRVVDRTVTPRPVPTALNPAQGLSEEARRTGAEVESRIREVGASYVRGVDLQAQIGAETARTLSQIRQQGTQSLLQGVGTGVQLQNRGLDALSQGLTNFFSGINRLAVNAQTFAVNYMEQERRAEEEAARLAGETDALRGVKDDKRLSSDDAYSAAWKEQTGIQEGTRLADAFKQFVKSRPPTDDARELAVEFFKQELKNDTSPYGFGTGDNIFDNALLSTYWEKVAPTVTERGLDAMEWQLEEGKITARQSAFDLGRAGDYSVSDVRTLMQSAEELHPDEPWSAKAMVLSKMAEGARAAGLDGIQRFVSFLENEKGFGPNGETFAEWRPQVMADLRDQLEEKFNEFIDIRGRMAVRQVDEMLHQLDDPELSLAEKEALLTESFAAINRAEDRFGGPASTYGGLRSRWNGYFDKLAEDLAVQRTYSGLISGETNEFVGQEILDKAQADYIEDRLGIDWKTSVDNTELAQVAGHIWSARGVSKELKQGMSHRLLNSRNPDEMLAGYQFYRHLKRVDNTPGKQLFNESIMDDAKAVFEVMDAVTNGGARDPGKALEFLSQVQNLPQKLRDFDMPALMDVADKQGAKSLARTKFVEEVTTAAESRINQWFDGVGDVAVSGEVIDRIERQVKLQAILMGEAGVSASAEDLIGKAVEHALSSADVVPGQGGTVVVRPAKYRNPSEVRFGTAVQNPSTGEAENTIETFRQDAQRFVSILDTPANGELGFSEADLSLTAGRYADDGMYTLLADGMPVMIPHGTEFQVGMQDADRPDQEVTKFAFGLDENGNWNSEIAKQHFALLTGGSETGLHFVNEQGLGYVTVLYKPRFVGKAPTVDEREAAWKPPAPIGANINDVMMQREALRRQIIGEN